MAAAVYLHNALFGQPSRTSTDNFRRDTDSNSDEEEGDGDADSEVDADVANAHPGSSRAPSSSSPMSRTLDVPIHPIPHVNEDSTTTHGRRQSASSQTTLVPITRTRYSHTPVAVTSLEHPLQEDYPLREEQQQQDEDAEADADREVARPASSSPLPPGLPASTVPTARRPLTPYPFPSDEAAIAAAATRTRSRSHSHSRSRPRGRRREDNPPEQSEPKRRSNRPRYTPPHLRTGRIPNPSFSQRTRITILAVRFALGLVLCGWSAFSCARYWLAYQGQPVPSPPVFHPNASPFPALQEFHILTPTTSFFFFGFPLPYPPRLASTSFSHLLALLCLPCAYALVPD